MEIYAENQGRGDFRIDLELIVEEEIHLKQELHNFLANKHLRNTEFLDQLAEKLIKSL